MSQPELVLVELDRRLSGDPSGTELRRLTDRLASGKARVVHEMDQGVTTEQFTRLATLVQAYDAGIDVLPKLWAAFNETGTTEQHR